MLSVINRSFLLVNLLELNAETLDPHEKKRLEVLIRLLLRKFHIHDLSYASLQTLSDRIFMHSDVRLSVNTLARIAGLRKDNHKPYGYTLDLLCSIYGAGTFDNFKRVIAHRSSLLLHSESEPWNGFLFDYAKMAVQTNDFKFLRSLEYYIGDHGLDFTAFYSLGHAFMLGARDNSSHSKLIRFVADSPILTQLFYETYVDLDYINGYFGEAMELLASDQRISLQSKIFSSAIVYLSGANTSNTRQTEVINLLSSLELNFIDDLLSQGYIYPVARWLRCMLDFHIRQRNHQDVYRLFEYSEAIIKEININDSMVIISELSEVKPLPPVFLQFLADRVRGVAGTISYEFDSYLNAALNLSWLTNASLISYSAALKFFNTHQDYFTTRVSTVRDKISRIKKT